MVISFDVFYKFDGKNIEYNCNRKINESKWKPAPLPDEQIIGLLLCSLA